MSSRVSTSEIAIPSKARLVDRTTHKDDQYNTLHHVTATNTRKNLVVVESTRRPSPPDPPPPRRSQAWPLDVNIAHRAGGKWVLFNKHQVHFPPPPSLPFCLPPRVATHGKPTTQNLPSPYRLTKSWTLRCTRDTLYSCPQRGKGACGPAAAGQERRARTFDYAKSLFA